MYYVIKHHFLAMINLKLSKLVRYTRTALDIIQYTQNEENRKKRVKIKKPFVLLDT